MSWLGPVAALGLVAGLLAFGRGLVAYRRGQRITGLGTSSIASIAAGEVRVSGTVEPDALTLVSPLQSETCVYYRARIDESSGRDSRTVFADVRAVGFRVRDASGSIRVFPREAGWDVPDDFDDRTGFSGDPPVGLRLNPGPTIAGVPDDSREAQIAALLTVHAPATDGAPGLGASHGQSGAQCRYVEARIAPGDMVTVVGWAVPFGTLDDPAASDELRPSGGVGDDDPALVADLEAARRAGILKTTPEEAWGNAAIAGFGIGRPVRTPDLDPGARPLPPGDAALAQRVERRFDIPDEELVLAATPEAGLAVFDGAPGMAAERAQGRFLLGLGGAVLAIASALTLAYLLRGGPFP